MGKIIQFLYTQGIIISILIIAGFLRLYKISAYMTFLGDEGRDVLVAYNILHGHLTFLGPTASVGGFFLGPIYYYFMAPFLFLFGYDPVGPAVMVALFGVATVWLIYKIGSEFFGQFAGLIAAALYTVSPLTIAYARSSWNPNLMPFFSLLTMCLLYKGISKKNFFLLFFSGVFYGIAIQLHYLELFLGVAIVIYVLFQKFLPPGKKIIASLDIVIDLSKKYLVVFFGFLIGFSPFLAFEIRHNFPNITSIINFAFHSKDTGGNGNFLFIIQDVFFRLFARLIGNFPPPEQLSLYNNQLITFWHAAILILALLSVGLLLKQITSAYKKNSALFWQYSLLGFWLFFGIVLFGFYKRQIYDYYFEFLFPLPFLLFGNLFASLFRKNILLKIIVSGVFIWLVILNLQGVPFRYPPNRQKDQAKTIAEFVLSKTDGKPFNFALITAGNSDHAYRYFFTVANRPPVTIENTEVDPQRKYVADQLMVICEDPNCHPLGVSLWEVAGFGRADIAGEWNVSVVKVFRLVHYKGPV